MSWSPLFSEIAAPLMLGSGGLGSCLSVEFSYSAVGCKSDGERGQNCGNIGLGQDQRRRQNDVVARHPHHGAILVSGAVDLADCLLVDRGHCGGISDKLQRAHQTMSTAHIADQGMLFLQRQQPFIKLLAARGGVVLDLQALGFLQAGDGGRGAYGVPGIGTPTDLDTSSSNFINSSPRPLIKQIV